MGYVKDDDDTIPFEHIRKLKCLAYSLVAGFSGLSHPCEIFNNEFTLLGRNILK